MLRVCVYVRVRERVHVCTYLGLSLSPGAAAAGAQVLQDHLHLRLGRRLRENRRVAQHAVVERHLGLSHTTKLRLG